MIRNIMLLLKLKRIDLLTSSIQLVIVDFPDQLLLGQCEIVKNDGFSKNSK